MTAGGDRAATVAALPKLIDTLRAKGFDFVGGLGAGKWTRDQAMPPVPANEASPVVNRYVFFTFSWLQGRSDDIVPRCHRARIGRLLALCGLALARPRAGETAQTPSRRG